MFELLYAIQVVFRAFGPLGLCTLCTAIGWYMARLRTAEDTGRVKTATTVLKHGLLVPGAYTIDDILLLCATPLLLSPSARKLPLPGSRISIMSCVEICASPIQDDGGASLVKGSGSLEDLQNDDTAGYLSDESVRFSTVSCTDTDILTLLF